MGILDAPVALDALDKQRAIALRPFHAALAQRSTLPVNVLGVGHSFMEGVRAGSYDTTLMSLFGSELRTRFPTAGAPGGFGSKSMFDTASWAGDAVVKSGSTGINRSYCFGRRAFSMSTTADTIVWTSAAATGFDINYIRRTVGAILYYKVDGGAAVTVDTNGSTAVMTIQIRGLAAGAHTLEIGYSSNGTGTSLTFDFTEFNGDETKGIRVFNSGDGSQQSGYWVDPAAQGWTSHLPLYPPQLVIITSMCNDYGGSGYTPVSSAIVKANLKTLITNIRAKNPSVATSFVLCTEYERAGASNAIEPWANYVNAAKAVAREDTGLAGKSSVLAFEMIPRFGQGPFSGDSGGFVDADNTHPAPAGYRHWAACLAGFVSPR